MRFFGNSLFFFVCVCKLFYWDIYDDENSNQCVVGWFCYWYCSFVSLCCRRWPMYFVDFVFIRKFMIFFIVSRLFFFFFFIQKSQYLLSSFLFRIPLLTYCWLDIILFSVFNGLAKKKERKGKNIIKIWDNQQNRKQSSYKWSKDGKI